MESFNTNIFEDFTSSNINYISLSFVEKKKKISIEEHEKVKDIYLSKKSKKNNQSEKDLKAIKNDTETKWKILNKAFELIINKNQKIRESQYNDFMAKLQHWLVKINSKKIFVKDKKAINAETDITESMMLDIFIGEFKLLFSKLLSFDETGILEELYANLFIKFLQDNYKSGELKSIFSELYNGQNNENKELLRILKIDYFQKCINAEDFYPDILANILTLKENNLRILDLTKHYLPFNDDGQLLSYSKFLQTVFESETYLEGMMILMNSQLKNEKFTKEDIKDSMSEIYKYLLHPIIFSNQEATKLYGITCINLHVYLSSFLIDNIENKINFWNENGHNDLERLNRLKSLCLSNVRTGVEFCVLIMTILHESSHVLRRHLIEPKVYIETEVTEKKDLLRKIGNVTRKENKCSITRETSVINEGGEILDFVLFGGTMQNLVAEEVKYILNLKNWGKDLKTFRNEFITLRDHLKMPLRLSKRLMLGSHTREGLLFCGNKKSGP